ncbi:hypothetical protein L1049_004178 [Liquidambar formosana]|uniref:Uncharacterized protein n=1 Tax=Liquidambar formosana TaxID=63359 RepID=A0AAP0RTE7_LIQFO
MDKVYIMVPMKRGNPATLSSEEARRMLYQANSVLKSRSLLSASRFLPLFAKICPGGTKDGHEFVSNRKEIVVERPEEACQTEFLPKILEGQAGIFDVGSFRVRRGSPIWIRLRRRRLRKKCPIGCFNQTDREFLVESGNDAMYVVMQWRNKCWSIYAFLLRIFV